MRENAEGLAVFHSTHCSLGCTTLTLAVARLLAGRGRSIAIVDADFLRPNIARAVGIAIAEGWESTLRSRVSLAESVIRSVEDGLSIVPLAGPLSATEICNDGLAARVVTALRQLAAHHDLVLIDGGCPAASPETEEASMRMIAAAADGCVLIAAEDLGEVDSSGLALADGPPIIGIVENRAAGP